MGGRVGERKRVEGKWEGRREGGRKREGEWEGGWKKECNIFSVVYHKTTIYYFMSLDIQYHLRDSKL